LVKEKVNASITRIAAGEPAATEPPAGGICQITVEDNGIGFDERSCPISNNDLFDYHSAGSVN